MFFFFNDTATTEIYTLSLHDALPISVLLALVVIAVWEEYGRARVTVESEANALAEIFWLAHRLPEPQGRHLQELARRSEEHTSELQSRQYLVCRLLLEKKTIITKSL